MKFNISNFHSIFEAADEKKAAASPVKDETGANLDNTLGDNDLLSMFDDICPITGDVYAAMKNAAADPKNLKITMVKDGSGTDSKAFVEAMEFANFCEAADLNPGEAKEEIIDAYKEDVPGIDDAEFHVVFPDEALNKNTLGGTNMGNAVSNDWAMRLMRGCRRYGIYANTGVEKKDDSLVEGFRFRGNPERRIEGMERRDDKNSLANSSLGKLVNGYNPDKKDEDYDKSLAKKTR